MFNGSDLGVVIGLIAICVDLVIVVFFFMLLSRIAAAQESMSRHLLEIAKDLKRLSHHFRDEVDEEDLIRAVRKGVRKSDESAEPGSESRS